MTVQPIASLDGPELAAYRTMRMQHAHWVERIFVAEGAKVVERLLDSELDVLSALMPVTWVERLRPKLERRADRMRVFTAEKKLLEGMTGYSMYQGVLAVARIPAPVPLEWAVGRSPRPRLFAALDGLANAENVGALVRSCVAFGLDALVVGENSSSPYLRRAVRSSMGTVFDLPILETTDLVGLLHELQRLGFHCVGAHPHPGGRTLPQARLDADCCLVFGSEGDGLTPSVRGACDECVAIPMPPHVDSLNVASAAAVFLYEASRQRGQMGAIPVGTG
jgi:tRNA G18 (ribose-2'-O)-methylase SpoU